MPEDFQRANWYMYDSLNESNHAKYASKALSLRETFLKNDLFDGFKSLKNNNTFVSVQVDINWYFTFGEKSADSQKPMKREWLVRVIYLRILFCNKLLCSNNIFRF